MIFFSRVKTSIETRSLSIAAATQICPLLLLEQLKMLHNFTEKPTIYNLAKIIQLSSLNLSILNIDFI